MSSITKGFSVVMNAPSKSQLISALENLQSCMSTVIVLLERYNHAETTEHAQELKGAREVVGSWIEGILEEDES